MCLMKMQVSIAQCEANLQRKDGERVFILTQSMELTYKEFCQEQEF